MSVLAAPRLMTTEEMLALPDGEVERWLIEGQLREKPLTVRNRLHSKVTASITGFLEAWRRQQPKPWGEVLCGEAGVRLRRTPDSTVGVDVVYISPALAAEESDETTLIDGVPVLVVEVLSPKDTLEEINEKVDAYLSAGVPLVWIVEPYRRTVTIHRPDEEPAFANVRDELTGEPHLPGFRVQVADLFE